MSNKITVAARVARSELHSRRCTTFDAHNRIPAFAPSLVQRGLIGPLDPTNTGLTDHQDRATHWLGVEKIISLSVQLKS